MSISSTTSVCGARSPGTSHTLAPRTIAPSICPPHAATLAAAIAAHGIAAHEDAVARLVHAARARDRAPTLAALVLDRGAPAVARERAFGRIDWDALVRSANADERLVDRRRRRGASAA